ncbi:endonuclease MutS2 [Clostridia bacterium]|nr:endonuclease MutS2 [Clostridia bacterium]
MFNEKTLVALEFYEILSQLENLSHNNVSREKAHNLRPTSNFTDCQNLCNQTDEAVHQLLKSPYPSTANLVDSRLIISRAEKSGMLSISDVLACGNLLAIARNFHKYFSSSVDENSSLFEFTSLIQTNKSLEDDILSSIISADELADNASSKLSSIRRGIRNTHAKIKKDMQNFLRSESVTKHLQEPIVTLRNERYVVPVKAESKSFIKGIIHDTSGSGSTFFIEPNFIIEMNNEINRQHILEEEEVQRILAEFSSRIAEESELFLNNFKAISNIDFIFTKARLSLAMHASAPRLNNAGKISIIGGRHPLIDPKKVVPINLEIGDDLRTLVVTGPNTGGKTVALKTVGLFCAMAASGLQIPAQHSSELPIFDGIYADIGDEQSIQQNLSTFSAHMTNIVDILANITPNSLVLFDELGAGTDPDEGAAIAIAILEYTKNAGAISIATTHYSQLKLYAMTESGVQNAGCEFDIETLAPTYKLIVGVPGKSNAFAISSRLGLAQNIIESATDKLDSSNIKFEDAIKNLHEKTRKLSEMHSADESNSNEITRLKKELEAEIARQKADRDKIKNAAKLKAKAIIDNAKKEAEDVIRELRTAEKSEIGSKVIDARTRLNKEANKTNTTLEVPAALLNPNRVTFGGKNGIKKSTISTSTFKSPDARIELDVRGYRLDEAIIECERFVDQSVVSGFSSITIIHGKGTGALRSGIHKMLKTNSNVKFFRLGTFGEGEMGVTIIELK